MAVLNDPRTWPEIIGGWGSPFFRVIPKFPQPPALDNPLGLPLPTPYQGIVVTPRPPVGLRPPVWVRPEPQPQPPVTAPGAPGLGPGGGAERESFRGDVDIIPGAPVSVGRETYNLGDTWFGRAARAILERLFPWARSSSPSPESVQPPQPQVASGPFTDVAPAPFLVGGVTPQEFIDTARRAGAGEPGMAERRAAQVAEARRESAERMARIDQLIRELNEGSGAGAPTPGESEGEGKEENELSGGWGRVDFF